MLMIIPAKIENASRTSPDACGIGHRRHTAVLLFINSSDSNSCPDLFDLCLERRNVNDREKKLKKSEIKPPLALSYVPRAPTGATDNHKHTESHKRKRCEQRNRQQIKEE
ncbi:hypothetical protein [Photobacterium sp. J15]|uniref:hypothetical protein n=1 Tax=Photobacterium sp. J15 TaxID=265901 RepID=UPI0007E451AC|nr:hypothetical protein [Photobacterium sp. J15]